MYRHVQAILHRRLLLNPCGWNLPMKTLMLYFCVFLVYFSSHFPIKLIISHNLRWCTSPQLQLVRHIHWTSSGSIKPGHCNDPNSNERSSYSHWRNEQYWSFREIPRLLEQFTTCIQAAVMRWTVDRYIKSLIQHFLSLEEGELRPANPHEWTVSVAGRSGAPSGNISWVNILNTTCSVARYQYIYTSRCQSMFGKR